MFYLLYPQIPFCIQSDWDKINIDHRKRSSTGLFKLSALFPSSYLFQIFHKSNARIRLSPVQSKLDMLTLWPTVMTATNSASCWPTG